MTSKFRSLLIRDVCDTSSGGTPSRKVSDYFSTPPEGHPWLASRELAGGLVHAAEEHISQLGLENSSAKYFPVDTVLLAMYGATAGKVGRLAIPMTTSQAICGMVAKKGICHQGFLYYLIKNESWKIVWKNALGGAQPNISQFSINNHPVGLPEFASQLKIYDHLNRIDMLIENQERQIQILQDAISSLFRSWFIDFDPVKAKTEGKSPYGTDEETASLFPDSFEDSELGPIPYGWRVGNLKDIQFIKGKVPKAKSVSSKIPLVNMDYLKSGNLSMIGSDLATIIDSGEIIMLMDGENSGFLTQSPIHGALGSTFAHLKVENIKKNFVYHLLLKNEYWVRRNTTGTGIPHVDKEIVRRIQFANPPFEIMKKFNEFAQNIFELLQIIKIKNASLSSIRDTLLPRLMSGELEV